MICKGSTKAQKQYQRHTLLWMVAYVVVLVCSVWFVKHDGRERFFLYFWSVVPAIPVMAVIWGVGRYLREETDEFLRLQTMRAILVGAGTLLATIVVNDFLRAFAHAEALPPFVTYLIFMASMGITQAVQKFRNRATDDD